MDELHDLFQERLARLEQGEPLEACLGGLPEEEASLLKMAAQLSTVNYPEQASDSVLAQRAKLLQAARAAKEKNAMTTKPRWVLPVALSGVAAFAFICVIAVAAMAGFASLRRSPSAPRQVAIVTPSQNGGPTQIVPIANPQSGTMANVRGNVRVQGDDGSWATMRNGQTVTAGKRIRTGPLSSATLVFYDGSQARLGPNTELWIDSLNAQTSGPRTIQLTQWVGDTKHDVAHSDDPASVYEVRTPSGTGTAKGTSFRVLVTALFVRFNVDEGKVAVTNLNITVIVVAGQSSTIPSGKPPSEPVFRISGEGDVRQIGNTWNIGGQTFLADADTIIIGNPQVGDRVAVEGRLLPNGSRLADLITLLHSAPKNTFSFNGIVDSIGSDSWTISGREVRVDGATVIDDGIKVGDAVEVSGGIAQDGTFWAGEIRKTDEAKQPFEFVGVIDGMAASGWTISGISIKVDEHTKVDEGLKVGDVVKVKGNILADGTWLATSIKLADEDEHKFEITGSVESMDPWKVAGVEFETDTSTKIDDGIQVGDRVKVKGRILEDGRWLADKIKLIEKDQGLRFEFIGKVASTDPWVIGGVTLATDENTKIADGIEVGDFVRVKGHILPDGTWLADDISPLEDLPDCFDTVVVVSNVTAEKIILLNGQTVKLKDIDLEGDVKVASIIIVHACVGKDGKTVIVSVIVIFQLDKLPDVIRPPDDHNNNNNNNGGNNDNKNCQDGDDHDHGKGNDCHKHGDDDGNDG